MTNTCEIQTSTILVFVHMWKLYHVPALGMNPETDTDLAFQDPIVHSTYKITTNRILHSSLYVWVKCKGPGEKKGTKLSSARDIWGLTYKHCCICGVQYTWTYICREQLSQINTSITSHTSFLCWKHIRAISKDNILLLPTVTMMSSGSLKLIPPVSLEFYIFCLTCPHLLQPLLCKFIYFRFTLSQTTQSLVLWAWLASLNIIPPRFPHTTLWFQCIQQGNSSRAHIFISKQQNQNILK